MRRKTKKQRQDELRALVRDAYGLSTDAFRARAHAITDFDVPIGRDSLLERVVADAQPEKVRILLDLGLSIDADALRAAASGAPGREEAALEVFEMLIDHGADPNLIDRHQLTALSSACDTSNWSRETRARVVERLLDAGAVPDIANKQGATPLHFAVYARQERVVELLVQAGADVHAKSTGASHHVVRKGDTPLSMARQMVERLEKPSDLVHAEAVLAILEAAAQETGVAPT
ncbi:MAG: ankyrin repeat domain-containing protein [Sandaracinaceae bacterium]